VAPKTLAEARERLRPYVKKAKGFTGWMAYVHSRRLGPERPWDYMARAKKLVAAASVILDIGTGGGERFGEIIAGYGKRSVATEEWEVNAPIAATHLRPLGADTVRCQSLHLPFTRASFDLVLDRHEELDPAEVTRILRPGATVLTQQVWQHWRELSRFFPRRSNYGDHFHLYQEGFRAAGLAVVDARTSVVPAAYEGLGDFVYMLCIAPWEIPGFDPLGADLEALLDLERELTTTDGLVLSDGSYVIEARKPA